MMMTSHASLAAGGKSQACFHYAYDTPVANYRSLGAINASIAEMQRSLVSLTNAVSQSQGSSAAPQQPPNIVGAPPISRQPKRSYNSLSMSDPSTIPAAPIQVIRNMNYWITGQRPDGKDETQPHGVASTVNLEASSEENYVRAFIAASPRYAFIHSELSKPSSPASGLLSASCYIVGAQACHESGAQNESLYEQVKKKLSLIMLNPPMDNSDLWAMLVLSTWNLGPANSGRFIDSWLLSGSTMLYSLLSYGFTLHETAGSCDMQDQKTRTRVIAWNASALLHLKFSVGTGKPCVFSTDILGQFATTIWESKEFSSDDKATAIELELYTALYQCVVQQVVHIDQAKAHLHTWKSKHTELLRRDAALKLGYNSAMLVLERWELAQLPPEMLVKRNRETSSSPSAVDTLTRSIIDSALAVLSSAGSMTSAFGTVPTYDVLLGTYAGVTLVQFADSLPDIRAVSELMLQVGHQRKSLRRREPVLTWASNMMQKKLLDLDGGESGNAHADVGSAEPQPQGESLFQWMPLGVLDTVGNSAPCT